MIFISLILLFFCGCAELDKVLTHVQTGAPIIDTFNPGLGTIISTVVGGIGAVSASVIVYKKTKKKSHSKDSNVKK
mgnify:CR=1 FL=1